jgi:hypothetical protein
MGTRLPQRLLYTMAVILAVLTMLFLILTMALKISDLLVSSSQTKDKSRIEATTVEKNEGGYDCDGSSALYDADRLTGRIAYVCNGDIYRTLIICGSTGRLMARRLPGPTTSSVICGLRT